MVRICPKEDVWHRIYLALCAHASSTECFPPSPPKVLILSGWAYTNDLEKLQRWQETVAWAEENAFTDPILEVSDEDFYEVETPSNYQIGPYGGPMYRTWDYESKIRPSSDLLLEMMHSLVSRWPEIVGEELGKVTKPLRFTGDKARRLLVWADDSVRPPWGGWRQRSDEESMRRTFTSFRSAINAALAPHEVDHIDFVTEMPQDLDCPRRLGGQAPFNANRMGSDTF